MNQLLEFINHLHAESYSICWNTFGRYFENAGNVGIFCQSDKDYENFNLIKSEITVSSDDPTRKYFELLIPLTIPEKEDIPGATYTHLYIRKPDPSPYGTHLGDIDFYVSEIDFEKLFIEVGEGKYKNAVQYEQPMIGKLIEMSESETGTLAYISTKDVTERIRFRPGQK